MGDHNWWLRVGRAYVADPPRTHVYDALKGTPYHDITLILSGS